MIYRHIFLIFLTVIPLAQGCEEDKSTFSHKELVEIYVYTAYIGDSNIELVKDFLGDKYNISSQENQLKYSNSLKLKAKTRQKWNLFIKDSIEYYIKLKKKLDVHYYHASGYDNQTNRFNDNFLLDPKNPLPGNYWKVSRLAESLKKNLVIHIKDYYRGGKLFSRTYFEHHHQKIKEIYYQPKKKVIYYQDNVPLVMPGQKQ